MPSYMAANIGVWNHPLSQTSQDRWLTQEKDAVEDELSGDEETGRGTRDLSMLTNHQADIDTTGRSFNTTNPNSSSRPPQRRPGPRDNGNQVLIQVRNRIFVGGLSEQINEDDLRYIFGQFGNVTEVAIKSRGGEQFRGFGFVTFSRNNEAADAIRVGRGEFFEMKGRKLNVCQAYKRVDKDKAASRQPLTTAAAAITSSTPTLLPDMNPFMGPAPTINGLPVVFHPHYFGPPVIAPNGTFYWGSSFNPFGMPPLPPAFQPSMFPGMTQFPHPLSAGLPFPMMPPPTTTTMNFGGEGNRGPSPLLGHDIGPFGCSTRGGGGMDDFVDTLNLCGGMAPSSSRDPDMRHTFSNPSQQIWTNSCRD